MERQMTTDARQSLFTILIVAIVLFFNLGKAKLWDRDEPRNARCAVEMMERHDWIVPTFNGELRAHKPVLLYWLMIGAYGLFGVNEFAARFSSALLAVGTAYLTYLIGRRLFDRTIGSWAAVILATSLMFQVVGRAATPDSTLIFFCTAALAVFVHSQVREGGIARRRFGDSIACGLPTMPSDHVEEFPRLHLLPAIGVSFLMALAVLAKGPVGMILPAMIMVTFGAVRSMQSAGRATDQVSSSVLTGIAASIRRGVAHLADGIKHVRPYVMLVTIVLIAAPWYVLVGIKTNGEWLKVFFGEHNLGRAASAMEGHDGSILYYPIALLVGFFPWSVFAVPAGRVVYRELRRKGPCSDGLVFLLSWLVCVIAPFSIAQTKLPNYITPAYPAVALLVAVGLNRCVRTDGDDERGWLVISAVCLGTTGLLMAVGLSIAAHVYLGNDQWLGLAGLIPLAGGVALFFCLKYSRRDLIWPISATSAALFCMGAFGIVASRVGRHQPADQMVAFAKNNPAVAVASFARHEPSWVFYAGQPVAFIPGHELSRAIEFLSKPEQRLITSSTDFDRIRSQSPFEVAVLAEYRAFLRKERLVVLARQDSESSPLASRRRGHSNQSLARKQRTR
jgi:4-amino-4-deoxy-L-arabinose transferase-like glycosyltransferase